MAFGYLRPSEGCLKQGEIIRDVFELWPVTSSNTSSGETQGQPAEKVKHPFAIVTTQDCDLHWDFEARHGAAPSHKMLNHIVFCDLFTRPEIRYRRGIEKNVFDRIMSNHDARFHRFAEAPVTGNEQFMPELIADFKKVFALPVEFVYERLSKDFLRSAVLPPMYLHEFIQRLYAFLSRVAIP